MKTILSFFIGLLALLGISNNTEANVSKNFEKTIMNISEQTPLVLSHFQDTSQGNEISWHYSHQSHSSHYSHQSHSSHRSSW